MKHSQGRSRQLKLIASGIAISIVLATMGAFLAVRLLRHDARETNSTEKHAVQAQALRHLQSVPADMPRSRAYSAPKALKGRPDSTGVEKVRVLYVGAEYCPYCAAQRWPLVIALSKFGEFHSLHSFLLQSDSGGRGIPTFSFHGAKYTSRYVEFVGKELSLTRRGPDGKHLPLDSLTSAQKRQFSHLTNGHRDVPLIDIADKYVVSGSQYDPSMVTGTSTQDVTRQILDSNSPTSAAIRGSAWSLVAAICDTTHMRPHRVCGNPYTEQLRKEIRARN